MLEVIGYDNNAEIFKNKYLQNKTDYKLTIVENFDYRNNPHDYIAMYQLSQFDSEYLGSDDDWQVYCWFTFPGN